MIIIVCPLNQMIQGQCQEICIFSSGKVFFCGLSVGIETASQKIHLPKIFGIIRTQTTRKPFESGCGNQFFHQTGNFSGLAS